MGRSAAGTFVHRSSVTIQGRQLQGAQHTRLRGAVAQGRLVNLAHARPWSEAAQAGNGHAAFGQRPGLVCADNAASTQRLNCTEALDQHASLPDVSGRYLQANHADGDEGLRDDFRTSDERQTQAIRPLAQRWVGLPPARYVWVLVLQEDGRVQNQEEGEQRDQHQAVAQAVDRALQRPAERTPCLGRPGVAQPLRDLAEPR
mmetsp:Transcript_101508/g.310418  ORF Transcript_101508/g.310418 Transcript_101508/m.310418 type:complete len:202 (-) Transcript_101508:235-840(-)